MDYPNRQSMEKYGEPPWPGKYPAWQSVYYYFRQWKNNGTLGKILADLAAAARLNMSKNDKGDKPTLLRQP
ncbi:MAG: hypothetical protein AAF632_18045 [Bacteroidota bacterium]